MGADLKTPRQWVSVLLFASAALVGCTAVSPRPEPVLSQRIEAAHSRTDHEALEAYFHGQAANARAKVIEHRDMLMAYQQQVVAGRTMANMAHHCQSLISGYERVADDYEFLASGERELAERARR